MCPEAPDHVASEQPEVVFEDDDIRVTVSRHSGPGAVVTFSPLNEHLREFGRDFFDRIGVSGIYCVAKWNHWWQPDGCRDALAPIRRVLAELPAGRRLFYGISMGAFGAALNSGRLGADLVLMLAPQYSMDPAKPPYETRWKREAARITFRDDDLGAVVSRTARKVVLFDNTEPDLAHAALLAEITGTELFPTPHGGHAFGHFLMQTKLLQDVVARALDGTLDYDWYRAEVRARRRISGNYWNRLGKQTQARRPTLSLDCFRRAAELRPKDVVLQNDYANALLRADRTEEAIEVFTLAHEMLPDAPAPLRGLSIANRRLCRFEASIEHAERALALRPESTDLMRVLAMALGAGGQHARALEVIGAALAVEPENGENLRLQQLIQDKAA